MNNSYKKHLLLGASCLALGFVSIPEANAESLCPGAQTTGVSCKGTESRLVTCRDFRKTAANNFLGNVVDTKYCEGFYGPSTDAGQEPSATRVGCDAVCPPSLPPNSPLPEGGDGKGDGDPLIFDMDGNGIALRTCADGVMFDIDNDGKPDQTGWTDGKDGLLAIDENGNGKIDNQSELFGNKKNTAYQHLATADSNNDGIIDKDDDIWDDLVMWQDKNTNGITDKGELKTMAELGMESIDVGYDTIEEMNSNHKITAEGAYTRITNGGKKIVNRVIEVFLDFFSG